MALQRDSVKAYCPADNVLLDVLAYARRLTEYYILM